MSENKSFKQESAGSLMTSKVPIASPHESVDKAKRLIERDSFDDTDTIYIVSDHGKFLGEVPIAKIITAKDNAKLEEFLTKPKLTVHPHMDQEKVIVEVVGNDVETVPVVDEENSLLGVITARKIIDVLHSEHLEDFLRFTGIRGRGSHILNLFRLGVFQVVWARLPWLLTGLVVGFGVTILTSGFETSLKENITLVFFIPMMAYMSDAIGTQSETIFIRSVTLLKLNLVVYFIREFFIGAIIGAVVGVSTGIFAFILSGSAGVGIVVALSLALSMTTATILACATPLVLKVLGKDPAVGSGPFSTAIQDFISLLIYFSIATIMLQNL